GAGKTNVLEAISLLAPGQGLRRSLYGEMAKAGGAGVWAVAATVRSAEDTISIGTGLTAESGDRAGRVVRINGETQSGAGALADRVEMLWVTPAMDGLFRGPASDRRRFLDRLVVSFDPSYRTRIGHFERAMRQRNRLLDEGVRDGARFDGLEMIMAEAGVAIAAARAEAVNGIEAMIAERRARAPDSPFPWAHLRLEGTLEQDLAHLPAVDVEDGYVHALRSGRERDRAAGRTLEGPHRSDLVVAHGPKAMPAHVCSTGEQKALLVGLVLAHAELEKRRRDGAAPILLLDEVAAHLDKTRRDALYAEIVQLGSQAWMTGTDELAFDGIVDDAQFIRLGEPTVGLACSGGGDL
ncbi:MAG TPA: DNA replication/repair protein RecF, partial [Hyphomicrobiaceae bacterium]